MQGEVAEFGRHGGEFGIVEPGEQRAELVPVPAQELELPVAADLGVDRPGIARRAGRTLPRLAFLPLVMEPGDGDEHRAKGRPECQLDGRSVDRLGDPVGVLLPELWPDGDGALRPFRSVAAEKRDDQHAAADLPVAAKRHPERGLSALGVEAAVLICGPFGARPDDLDPIVRRIVRTVVIVERPDRSLRVVGGQQTLAVDTPEGGVQHQRSAGDRPFEGLPPARYGQHVGERAGAPAAGRRPVRAEQDGAALDGEPSAIAVARGRRFQPALDTGAQHLHHPPRRRFQFLRAPDRCGFEEIGDGAGHQPVLGGVVARPWQMAAPDHGGLRIVPIVPAAQPGVDAAGSGRVLCPRPVGRRVGGLGPAIVDPGQRQRVEEGRRQRRVEGLAGRRGRESVPHHRILCGPPHEIAETVQARVEGAVGESRQVPERREPCRPQGLVLGLGFGIGRGQNHDGRRRLPASAIDPAEPLHHPLESDEVADEAIGVEVDADFAGGRGDQEPWPGKVRRRAVPEPAEDRMSRKTFALVHPPLAGHQAEPARRAGLRSGPEALLDRVVHLAGGITPVAIDEHAEGSGPFAGECPGTIGEQGFGIGAGGVVVDDRERLRRGEPGRHGRILPILRFEAEDGAGVRARPAGRGERQQPERMRQTIEPPCQCRHRPEQRLEGRAEVCLVEHGQRVVGDEAGVQGAHPAADAVTENRSRDPIMSTVPTTIAGRPGRTDHSRSSASWPRRVDTGRRSSSSSPSPWRSRAASGSLCRCRLVARTAATSVA